MKTFIAAPSFSRLPRDPPHGEGPRRRRHEGSRPLWPGRAETEIGEFSPEGPEDPAERRHRLVDAEDRSALFLARELRDEGGKGGVGRSDSEREWDQDQAKDALRRRVGHEKKSEGDKSDAADRERTRS